MTKGLFALLITSLAMLLGCDSDPYSGGGDEWRTHKDTVTLPLAHNPFKLAFWTFYPTPEFIEMKNDTSLHDSIRIEMELRSTITGSGNLRRGHEWDTEWMTDTLLINLDYDWYSTVGKHAKPLTPPTPDATEVLAAKLLLPANTEAFYFQLFK
jgi:hypothetical protein